jgi:phosphate transport system protein
MASRHIVSSFDRDLESLQAMLMKMGGLVEQALTDAAIALRTQDVDRAETVRRGDRAIDELDLVLKSDAAKLLALRAPTAGDLRTVLSVIEISSHLERCGDYAKNIAKRTTAMAAGEDDKSTHSDLQHLHKFVEAMVKDALDAFIGRDVDLAQQIIERDLEADQIYNGLFRALLTEMMEGSRSISAGMHLHFIAKNVERVGDHATGIAEQTVYLVTGVLPDEDRPKEDPTSLPPPEGSDG